MRIPSLLHRKFEAAAARHPNLVALEVGGQSLTYAELAAASANIAALLAGLPDLSSDGPRTVALLCGRSSVAYAGYLAALRLGATVVPLNTGTPPGRTASICRAAHVDAVITDMEEADAAAALGVPVPVLAVDKPVTVPPRHEPRSRPAGGERRDPTYVLFTSGSTGQPKGIPIRDSHLRGYLEWCAVRYDVGPGRRLAQTFALTFDPSVFATFLPWSAGGTVVVASDDDLLFPARFVREQGITHWFSVPSVVSLAHRFGSLGERSMPDLRWSLFAGEQFTFDQAGTWHRAAPNSVMENLYGPTEMTITCCGYRLPPQEFAWPRTSNGTVPIGLPHPHVEAALIGAGRVADEEGELFLRGPQRFDGYLDPSLNAGRFAEIEDGVAREPAGSAPHANLWYRTGDRVRIEDALMVHAGRVDDQVKVAGHRVELGDVEHAVRLHHDVDEVAVVFRQDVPGGELVAFYVGHEPDERGIRKHLAQTLPRHMVPRLVRLNQLPRTPNGKVDKGRLRANEGVGRDE